jgi:hypothetical protein
MPLTTVNEDPKNGSFRVLTVVKTLTPIKSIAVSVDGRQGKANARTRTWRSALPSWVIQIALPVIKERSGRKGELKGWVLLIFPSFRRRGQEGR